MSSVIKELIKKWTQADAPVSDFNTELSGENYEDVKAYISQSLKAQFKVFCTQKQVTMRYALYNLINEWVDTETDK